MQQTRLLPLGLVGTLGLLPWAANAAPKPNKAVPTLILSPYAKPGCISHTRFDFTSPLKLIETKYGLPPLTARDAAANAMRDCFDFKQKPLPPDVITPQTKLDFSGIQTETP